MDSLLHLLLIYPILYLSVFFHEIGHALMARWQGFEVTSFGMGITRPLIVASCDRTRIHLCLKQPFQGLTVNYTPQLFASRRQWLWILAGGSLANFLIGLLALALGLLISQEQEIWLWIAALNGFLALLALMPMEIRVGSAVLRSDGGQILRRLQNRSTAYHPYAQARQYTAMCRHLQAIGDTRGLYIFLMMAIGAYLELGDTEAAKSLYSEARELPGREESFRQAHSAYIGGIIALEAGELEEAQALIEEAGRVFQKMGHANGQLLVEWLQALLALARQDASEALARCNALAHRPLFQTESSLRAALLVSRLRAAAQVDRAQAERLLAEYEALKQRQPSYSRDLYVYQAMACMYVREGKWESAELFFQKALEIVKKLYLGIADGELRSRFGQRQSNLVQQAQTCLHGLGKNEEAQNLDSLLATLEATFQDKTKAAERKVEIEQRRLRRQDWLSLFCILFDCAVGAGAWSAPNLFPMATSRASTLQLVGIFTLVAAVLNVVFYLCARGYPGLRRLNGFFAIGLTLMLWIAALLLLQVAGG